MAGTCGTYRGKERHIAGLSGETSQKELVGRPSVRWENKIKMDYKDVDCGEEGGLYKTAVSRDRDRRRSVMNEVMKLRVPYNVGDFLTS
jgi:hypothetical protein